MKRNYDVSVSLDFLPRGGGSGKDLASLSQAISSHMKIPNAEGRKSSQVDSLVMRFYSSLLHT